MTGPAGTNEGMATAETAVPAKTTADTGLRADAEQALRALAGPAARLREDQWTAISALVAGRRALVVQRTGWGKSAVYFLATALLRARDSSALLNSICLSSSMTIHESPPSPISSPTRLITKTRISVSRGMMAR